MFSKRLMEEHFFFVQLQVYRRINYTCKLIRQSKSIWIVIYMLMEEQATHVNIEGRSIRLQSLEYCQCYFKLNIDQLSIGFNFSTSE